MKKELDYHEIADEKNNTIYWWKQIYCIETFEPLYEEDAHFYDEIVFYI